MAGRVRRSAAVRVVEVFDPLGGGRLWVALSRSHPARGYLLRQGPDGRPLCGCPGFSWRGDCEHVATLSALLRPGGSQGAILTAGNEVAAGDTTRGRAR